MERSLFYDEIVRSYEQPKQIPIAEFCESSEFCEKQLFPKQRVLLKLWFLEDMEGWEEDVVSSWIRGDGGCQISPAVRERRDWLKSRGYKHFTEIISDGGRRSSKGYTTGAAVAKKIFDVQQLSDPGAHYGIDPDREIVFAVVANKLQQATDMQFSDIASWVSRCKPLQPHIPGFLEESFSIHTLADKKYQKELEAMGIKVSADWAKLVCRPLPANQSTIRGMASMVVCFDEMAHMLGTEGRASGSQCYEAAEPSLRQFGRDALLFANSSPYTEIGQFYELYERAMQMDGPHPAFPTMLFFNFPTWELYTDWRRLPTGSRFERLGALMVSPDAPDEGLTEEELAKRDKARLDERANPEAYAVEYRAQWAKVVDAYLSPMVVDRAFAPEISYGTPPIFQRSVRMSSTNNYLFRFKGHCDPSSTTAGFGFAVAHMEMMPDPHQPTQECQHVVFDVVKRWDPAIFPGHTINYLDVQQQLADYAVLYRLYELTFDQFQSQAPIQWLNQELRQRRMNTRVFEITATKQNNWNRYETFKTAMNLGLVHIPPDCPDSDYASEELKFLQVKNGRVDKQDVGPVRTKDIADCICEVTAHLLGDAIAQRMGDLNQAPQFGAEGGYRIGGHQMGGPMGGGHAPGMASGSFEEYYSKTAQRRGQPSDPTRGAIRKKRNY